MLWLKWLFVQKDYIIIGGRYSCPMWNYLYECSGITGGGIVPPTFFTRKFYDLPRKRDKEGNGEEKKENLKGKKWKIENRRGKVWKWAEDLLFYLFIYLFIYLLVTFWTLKFVWGLPEWTILPGKIIFHAGTKSGHMTLLPLKNITPTPLHRFSDSTIDDYNDVWYSPPCPLIWKPPCLSNLKNTA